MNRSVLYVAALGLLLGGVIEARAGQFNGTLFFTTFSGSGNDRLHDVKYTYDSSVPSLTLSSVNDIITNQSIGADGLIFAPDGKTLIVGGQGPIYHVDPSNGHVLQTLTTGGVTVYHIALSPDGNTVYGGGSEGGSAGLAVVPTNPYANGTTKTVTGSNSIITGVAFDGQGNGFYTSSGVNGGGNFGTLTGLPNAPVTKALITNLTAAHGITYDPFTGDFILVGGNQIAQVDTSGKILSTRLFSNFNSVFDQASVDGQGHLFVANNDGNVLFVDYSQSGLVGDLSDFTSKNFLANFLDDTAPLAGLGSQTPEPATVALLAIGIAGMAGYGWRGRKQQDARH
ncbi:MAG TPA: PEP-CTERM sorting domain-containing protein [Gemmataceae bacterium]|jgi:hypothetical protein|nr:PEP-CTERM sorting domain-containing protein [Gemmataceae bacterium]